MSAYHVRHRPVRRRLYPMPAAGVALSANGLGWPEFWATVQSRLREQGYSNGTLRIYRHVLRSFSKWFYSRPDRVTAASVSAYVWSLTEQKNSWSWTSLNISALRVMFDRLCGLAVCKDVVTPKRSKPVPGFIGREETWRLLSAAETPRDQLMLGLMYGCGMKVGELCALRWADVDCPAGTLRIGGEGSPRLVCFPIQLGDLLAKGRSLCSAEEYIFQGNKAGTHLSTRMAEYTLRRAAELAKLDRPVCGMMLRHSYAVHRLQDGASVRDVQESLGLRRIHSAMLYLRCLPPSGAESPLEHLRAGTVQATAAGTDDTDACVMESDDSPERAPAVPAPDMPAALPFEPVNMTLAERARLFYRSFRLHVRARYLALRHAVGAG